MEQVILDVEMRAETGKGPARRLRQTGKVPAVMYKCGADTVSLKVNVESLMSALKNGRNTVITLKLDKGGQVAEHTVMVKKLQYEPIYDRLVHVDFIGIDIDKPIDVEVTIELEGIPAGIATGGILQQILRKLTVRCLPTAIPKHVTANVKDLKLNDSLHVRDMVMPEGIQCVEDPDAAVASVLAPQLEVVEKKAEGEEGEEGAAAAAPAAGAEAAKKEGAAEDKKGDKKEEKKGDKKGK